MLAFPGGASCPSTTHPRSSIRHILVRHEQGAGHMAQGYAQVTRQARRGHGDVRAGCHELVTPLADAYMDSTPLVVVTGQVAILIGTEAFQESDITGITMGFTKHNWLITDVGAPVAEAFHVWPPHRTGPGPVLIDIPKDIAMLPW